MLVHLLPFGKISSTYGIGIVWFNTKECVERSNYVQIEDAVSPGGFFHFVIPSVDEDYNFMVIRLADDDIRII